MYKNFPSLAEAFINYFDVAYAQMPNQIELVEKIRYRVYCQEFGYEPAENFPNRRESDEYDRYSLQSLITHRRSGQAASCVRVICASNQHTLPLEDYCRESLYLEYLESLGEDRDEVCEVSRLAVDPAFRKRFGEDHTRLGEFDALDYSHQEQRTFSLVSTASFLAALALADLAGQQQIFAMMEPNLPRLLRRVGLLFQQAGDTTDYHGTRTPYFLATNSALENMREDLHVLYDAIYQNLAQGFSMPKPASVA